MVFISCVLYDVYILHSMKNITIFIYLMFTIYYCYDLRTILTHLI